VGRLFLQMCRLNHLSVCRSVGLSVCLSVGQSVFLSGGCIVEKTDDWIWMPLGVVSWVGRGMDVLDGSGDRLRGRGNFGGECGATHCN